MSIDRSTDSERPVYEGACAICGWQMRREGNKMVCSQPGCRRRRPLPVDQVLGDRRTTPLPGLKS